MVAFMELLASSVQTDDAVKDALLLCLMMSAGLLVRMNGLTSSISCPSAQF